MPGRSSLPTQDPATESLAESSAALAVAASATAAPSHGLSFRRNEIWAYFGPAFVASVAYIDPGNFATNIEGGSRFGYRLLWVLLWSNAMAILIQYLSAKLGIVTGCTLPQNCRKHFSRPMTIFLWVAAEISAIATDLAEFLGAALGMYLLAGPILLAHGWSRTGTLLLAALVAAVLVFVILALDLAGYRWLERGIMGFVGIIGLCYGFEVFLVHPDWRLAAFHALVPTLDTGSAAGFHESIYLAVGMLGATVMPHVSLSALCAGAAAAEGSGEAAADRRREDSAAVSKVRADRCLRRDERSLADQLRDDHHGGGRLRRTTAVR